jgi:hypothetical protein
VSVHFHRNARFYQDEEMPQFFYKIDRMASFDIRYSLFEISFPIKLATAAASAAADT